MCKKAYLYFFTFFCLTNHRKITLATILIFKNTPPHTTTTPNRNFIVNGGKLTCFLFSSLCPSTQGQECLTHRYPGALTTAPGKTPQKCHLAQWGQSSRGALVQSTGGQAPATRIHQSVMSSYTVTWSAEVKISTK